MNTANRISQKICALDGWLQGPPIWFQSGFFNPANRTMLEADLKALCRLLQDADDPAAQPLLVLNLFESALRLRVYLADVVTGDQYAQVSRVLGDLETILLAKNASYGDSALHTVRIFSRADARAGLATRIDDKLSRIFNSPGAFGEDPVLDLLGYLVFWMIVDDLDAEAAKAGTP